MPYNLQKPQKYVVGYPRYGEWNLESAKNAYVADDISLDELEEITELILLEQDEPKENHTWLWSGTDWRILSASNFLVPDITP